MICLVFPSGGHTASSPVWKPVPVAAPAGSLGVFSFVLTEVLKVWGAMVSADGEIVKSFGQCYHINKLLKIHKI